MCCIMYIMYIMYISVRKPHLEDAIKISLCICLLIP